MKTLTVPEIVTWLREQAYECHIGAAVLCLPEHHKKLQAAADALAATPTRDELLAMVTQLKGAMSYLHGQCEEHLPGYAYSDEEAANEKLLTLTPTDAVELLPMSEAPRDGSQVLIYSNQHTPPWFVCIYIDGQWLGGASYLPDTPHWVKGWRPLPKVKGVQG